MTDARTSAAEFTSLVAGLAATAMATLAQVEGVLAGSGESDAEDAARPADADRPAKVQRGLTNARHVIDTLAMLERKTAGNLTADEQLFLASTLTQLRVSFVRANDRARGGEQPAT